MSSTWRALRCPGRKRLANAGGLSGQDFPSPGKGREGFRGDRGMSPRKLDVSRVREDFPILTRQVNGKRLVYLDNAATSQKPNQVIDALSHFYRTSNANIHRGIHTLAQEATRAYEDTRKAVARFLGG